MIETRAFYYRPVVYSFYNLKYTVNIPWVMLNSVHAEKNRPLRHLFCFNLEFRGILPNFWTFLPLWKIQAVLSPLPPCKSCIATHALLHFNRCPLKSAASNGHDNWQCSWSTASHCEISLPFLCGLRRPNCRISCGDEMRQNRLIFYRSGEPE